MTPDSMDVHFSYLSISPIATSVDTYIPATSMWLVNALVVNHTAPDSERQALQYSSIGSQPAVLAHRRA